MDSQGGLEGRATSVANIQELHRRFCAELPPDMLWVQEPNQLRARILRWLQEEVQSGALPSKTKVVLEAMLYRGELARNEIPKLLGMTDRHARRITSTLLEAEVLSSDGDRSPLRLAFPARLAGQWMPGLFPDQ